jgi:hypothetical protein
MKPVAQVIGEQKEKNYKNKTDGGIDRKRGGSNLYFFIIIIIAAHVFNMSSFQQGPFGSFENGDNNQEKRPCPHLGFGEQMLN